MIVAQFLFFLASHFTHLAGVPVREKKSTITAAEVTSASDAQKIWEHAYRMASGGVSSQ